MGTFKVGGQIKRPVLRKSGLETLECVQYFTLKYFPRQPSVKPEPSEAQQRALRLRGRLSLGPHSPEGAAQGFRPVNPGLRQPLLGGHDAGWHLFP